jgi:hypothetical protein
MRTSVPTHGRAPGRRAPRNGDGATTLLEKVGWADGRAFGRVASLRDARAKRSPFTPMSGRRKNGRRTPVIARGGRAYFREPA